MKKTIIDILAIVYGITVLIVSIPLTWVISVIDTAQQNSDDIFKWMHKGSK